MLAHLILISQALNIKIPVSVRCLNIKINLNRHFVNDFSFKTIQFIISHFNLKEKNHYQDGFFIYAILNKKIGQTMTRIAAYY